MSFREARDFLCEAFEDDLAWPELEPYVRDVPLSKEDIGNKKYASVAADLILNSLERFKFSNRKTIVQQCRNRKDIIDKRRMNLILKNIKRKSIKNNIDPRVTNKIWKSIIWSYIDYQKRNFKKK